MDNDKVSAELVNLRSDVLYLVRLVEKLEKKIGQLEQKVESNKQPNDIFAGMNIEKL